MQAQKRQTQAQTVRPMLISVMDDRRFAARPKTQAKDQELVRHFSPGRIPTLLRQAQAEKNHRALDIAGAIFGLLLFAPLLLPAMLMIKLTSKGPIFYSQIRVGRGGKLFRMFKLRTMVVNAEKLQKNLLALNEQSGAAFKMKNDPRVTRIGYWLRRYSLDEVPQFLNVLRGEMSLVGPRPPLPREVKSYKRWQLQRLMVKPGLTGLWQISGRNRLDFDDWVRLDIRYIKQRNLMFDIMIMLKTFVVIVLKPDGQ